jgi:hypothetical protein
MTGPEHYRRAEELLVQAYDLPAGSGNEFGALLAAQVHATLALAAEKLGTLEERQLSEMLDNKIHEEMQAHLENEPHIYPDGSRS